MRKGRNLYKPARPPKLEQATNRLLLLATIAVVPVAPPTRLLQPPLLYLLLVFLIFRLNK